MQPPQKEGAWRVLFSNLSKSGLENYVVKRSKRPLLEEVARSRLPCPICIKKYLTNNYYVCAYDSTVVRTFKANTAHGFTAQRFANLRIEIMQFVAT